MRSGDVLVVPQDQAQLDAGVWLCPVDDQRRRLESWKPICRPDAIVAGVNLVVTSRSQLEFYFGKSSCPNRLGRFGVVPALPGYVSHRKASFPSVGELRSPRVR